LEQVIVGNNSFGEVFSYSGDFRMNHGRGLREVEEVEEVEGVEVMRLFT
jgi:hypothetical protein